MTAKIFCVGSMFDGTAMAGPSAVVVKDGTIVDVRSVWNVNPADGEVIDLGAYACLMPGLVDCHVHLAFDASSDPVGALDGFDDPSLFVHMRGAAKAALNAGITTVRDLGDRNFLTVDLAHEFRHDLGEGPEILSAGPPLTTPGGHCYFLGGQVEGAEALRKAVRLRKARGCSVVKVMASGGNMTPGSAPHQSQYSLEDLRVIVEEAHGLGLPVAAHAHGSAAIADAVAAGVDTLEHVTFRGIDGNDPEPELIETIARSETVVSMTMGLAPAHLSALPAAMARQFDAITAGYRALHEAGAKIVVGSDAGIGAFKPHDVLPDAATDLLEIGLSPLSVLATLTSVAADTCGVGHRKGRVKVGADADFLVVNGDPTEDLARLRDVRAVYRAGVRVRPA